VVAIYTTSFTLCQVVGPLVTDAVAGFPRQAFLICGGVFLLGIPGIAMARDERSGAAPAARAASGQLARRPESKDPAASWWIILRDAPSMIAGAALFAAFDNIILSFLPVFALDRGFSRTRALSAVVVVLLGDAALQFAAGSLADRLGRARVHRWAGIGMCILLPLLPLMAGLHLLWEAYLFLLGGVAGSIYTLALVSSGERFSGPALLRASGLIALTWNLASSVGPAATGVLMRYAGSNAMTAVLLVMSTIFVMTTRPNRPTEVP
jgi:MFS family permease